MSRITRNARAHLVMLAAATAACGSGFDRRFGSVRCETQEKPNPVGSWRVVTRPGPRTARILPGWDHTAVQKVWFLYLWLQLSISVLITL